MSWAAAIGLALAAAPTPQGYGALQRFDPTQDVGIDQRLGQRIPLDAVFLGEDGAPVELGQLLGGKPVVLSLVYYECPMLCTLVLNDQLRALRALPLELGRDYTALTLSIDPRETPELAAAKRDHYLEAYRRDAGPEQRGAWRFLVGGEASIRALADAVGFRYVYDEEHDEYAHAAGLIVLTAEGVVSRYFFGVQYSPKDLRLALVEAGGGRVGSFADQALLLCYHFDPTTGRYGWAIMGALRVAGGLTLLLLGGFLARNLLRERRERRAAEARA
jgi:protein SCO1/2